MSSLNLLEELQAKGIECAVLENNIWSKSTILLVTFVRSLLLVHYECWETVKNKVINIKNSK